MSEEISDVVREFLEFRNRQKGAYMDALSGFAGNRREVFRQVAYVNVPTGMTVEENGEKTILFTRFEDPASPDVIHHRIVRAADFIAENSPGGSNEQQQSRAILIFLFTAWELEYRPRLAAARGVPPGDVKFDIMGDLRRLRNVVLHKKGVMTEEDYTRLTCLGKFFRPSQEVRLSPLIMDTVFQLVDRDATKLLVDWEDVPAPPFPIDSTSVVAIGPEGPRASSNRAQTSSSSPRADGKPMTWTSDIASEI